ncbi:ComF family protein [Rubellicoccus peritrichatus]|uniref:ComF family protein n=1 Tax=Rubellicoccus peritrichatus TaxID=3080537 RepID=A0AAQ3LI83_9BACT|nr:ComF family protein [Puniceicoccus sp. CR14]WOO42559.1 ComF family protein [Puniceicoccus sp. CR14]
MSGQSSLESLTLQTLALSKEVLRGMRDLVFPRDCLVTGIGLDEDGHHYLSGEAVRNLYPIRSPHCQTCGFPFFGELIGTRECPHCIELDPDFEQGRSLLLARDTGRALIHELKYRGGAYVLSDIQRILADVPEFRTFLEGATLIPVPLHRKRQRKRGFNQSLLLAELFAREVNEASVANILCRTRNTSSQTRLKRRERHNNVKNAFALRRGAIIDSGIRYVLIDDVFTTGATLNACSKVLRSAGAGQIDVATLAHG